MKFGSKPHMKSTNIMMASSNTSSDFNQWLHAMKMVARLPGGMPPEFRRKLWLALAERHIQTKQIDWEKEQRKCLCEQNRDDDEELGIQIVKDLHRTGSSLFSGPAGSLNQAKLKRVLLGYARWNPEVGYCQGFNMLGALILQVMDKNDIESLKVMIFLVEGILPAGYFSGSLGGLQTDMAVFRDILADRLPKLARHLQKLQGQIGEGSFEPPLTNVFTMQWFLTLFCTCLPINCVLRVWDLVLIEGSDVLIRTALAIWGLLEERILATKTADDFYCKMGMLSGELVNGHLFDSNGLIQKVVDLGPIPELQKMRDKHISNITPWRDKRGLRLFFSDDEGDSDDDSRLAITAAWGIRLGRRSSIGLPSNSSRPVPESKDRIALDISLLKKQYDKLRERQRQAHIILTNSARQTVDSSNSSSLPVNQYLMGRSAIVSSKGRRIGPPPGAIPPARLTSTLKSSKNSPKSFKRGETLLWKDIDANAKRKELNTDNDCDTVCEDRNYSLKKSSSVASSISSASETSAPTSSRSHKKSESSSYSDDSDGNSSTSTSLCDDENIEFSVSSIEASPLRKKQSNEVTTNIDQTSQINECIKTLNEIKSISSDLAIESNSIEDDTFKSKLTEKEVLTVSINLSANPGKEIVNDSETGTEPVTEYYEFLTKTDYTKPQNEDKFDISMYQMHTTLNPIDTCTTINNLEFPKSPIISVSSSEQTINLDFSKSPIISVSPSEQEPLQCVPENVLSKQPDDVSPNAITSTSQLSPIADISKYLSSSSISPLRTPSSFLDYTDIGTVNSPNAAEIDQSAFTFKVNDEGVTNEYFERITAPERPSRLELRTAVSDNVKIVPFNLDAINVVDKELTTDSPELHISPIGIVKVENMLEEFPVKVMNTLSMATTSNFLREKSYSLDEPSMTKEQFRPTSCPEAINENYSNNSDRILKIIEENSKILHRILKKNTSTDDDHTVSTAETSVHTQQYFKDDDDILIIPSTTNVHKNISALDEDTGDITETLCSIKNTIRSIDSLCQYDEITPVELLDCDSRNTLKTLMTKPTTPCIENIIIEDDLTTKEILVVIDEPFIKPTESSSSHLSTARYSRDSRRDVSPRRKRDDEREEYESRFRRDSSVCSINTVSYDQDSSPSKILNISNNRTDTSLALCSPVNYSNQTILYSKNENPILLDPIYKIDKSNFISNVPNSITTATTTISTTTITTTTAATDALSKSCYMDKFEIRHTTVTSTFYDRYLYQKKERNIKLDKSPSSPVITANYLDSLRIPPITDRNSKSAENSPSRSNILDTAINYETFVNCSTTKENVRLALGSCNNIPANLNNKNKNDYFVNLTTKEGISSDEKLSSDLRSGIDLYKNSLSTSPEKKTVII